jgi:hypothetical protein
MHLGYWSERQRIRSPKRCWGSAQEKPMSLRVIFDSCEPRDEILRGDLRDEMFAARLRDVTEDRADPIYQETRVPTG